MITELSKRRVFRVVSGYAVVCFVVLQIADVAFEPLGISDLVLRTIIAIMLLGLPVVAYLSWVFDVDPELNLKRASGGRPILEAGLALLAMVLLAGGIWYVLIPSVPEPGETTTAVEPEQQTLTRSLAIAEFTTVGTGETESLFASGLSEELNSIVSGYPELRVVAGPVRQFSSIVSEGSPSYLVTGNIQSSEIGIRLRIQLLRVSNSETVWSKTFDVSRLQNRQTTVEQQTSFAMNVARYVRLQLVQDHQCELVKRSSSDSAAAEYFCAALAEDYKINQGGNADPAVRASYARKALELAPSLSDARAYVAVDQLLSGKGGRVSKESIVKARKTAEIGLESDPNNVFLLFAGTLIDMFDFRYDSAESYAQRALAADPLHPNIRWIHGLLGQLDLRQGDVESARTHYARAVSGYDADARIFEEYSQVLNYVGEYQQAIEAADAGMELLSGGSLLSALIGQKARALIMMEKQDIARDLLEEFVPTISRETIGLLPMLPLVGRADEAEAVLDSMTNLETPPIELLCVTYAALNYGDNFFQLVSRAPELHSSSLIPALWHDPIFEDFRKDSRWGMVVELMELSKP